MAYCLGIHDVDPIAHNLYFERFLSLERHDPPDIDLDLCSHRRDEVIDYVYRNYGADHVAMVCTYATLRARYALREVGKAYGLPEARIKRTRRSTARLLAPGRAKADARRAGRTDRADARPDRARSAGDEPRARRHAAPPLDSSRRHRHLAGPITDLVPLQHATKGLLVTQFDMGGIEKLGLVKIDLLGISALTVIADCVELIRAANRISHSSRIPLEDRGRAQALDHAARIGCFQIESPGMRMTLRELSARNVNDLIVALALYRPGPLKGGLKDAFVRRHLGQELPSICIRRSNRSCVKPMA